MLVVVGRVLGRFFRCSVFMRAIKMVFLYLIIRGEGIFIVKEWFFLYFMWMYFIRKVLNVFLLVSSME